MITIHPVHRRLAEITYMCTNHRTGDIVLGMPELRMILPLLRQNMMLVRQLDELKELAFVAHCTGDFEWEQEICRQIDELEARMI